MTLVFIAIAILAPMFIWASMPDVGGRKIVVTKRTILANRLLKLGRNADDIKKYAEIFSLDNTMEIDTEEVLDMGECIDDDIIDKVVKKVTRARVSFNRTREFFRHHRVRDILNRTKLLATRVFCLDNIMKGAIVDEDADSENVFVVCENQVLQPHLPISVY